MAKFSDNAITVSGKLTKKERTKLDEHCAVIDRWVDGWHEIGARMAAIRDDRLYRETHTTFEAFVHDRWGLGKSHAYRLIGCAEVYASLSPMGDILPPKNERQARELIDLDENQRADVWVKANELAELAGKEVTAKIVAEVKRELFPPEVEPEPPTVIDGESVDVTPEEEASPEQFVETIMLLLEDGGEDVQREIYEHLRAQFEPKPKPKTKRKVARSSNGPGYTADFETFWAVFPSGRKAKKGEAFKRWKTALKDTKPKVLVEAAEEYAESPKGQSAFVQGPATWLNQRCWEDDRKAWQDDGERNGKPKKKKVVQI